MMWTCWHLGLLFALVHEQRWLTFGDEALSLHSDLCMDTPGHMLGDVQASAFRLAYPAMHA